MDEDDPARLEWLQDEADWQAQQGAYERRDFRAVGQKGVMKRHRYGCDLAGCYCVC